MNILVCIKQVPGTTNVEVDPVTGVIKRDGVMSKLNPYDLFAIEMGLRLKEQYGGSVSVITMGPNQAQTAVLESIYMGADGGCVISDRRFAGADVLATSYTLSQGIRKMGNFDLIICGKQTTDGDTAQVGAELAEFLNLPHVGNVLKVLKVEQGRIELEVGLDEHIVQEALSLPCLICTEGDVNTPRLPSYKRQKALGSEGLRFISLDDFDDQNERHYGLNGSPTQVERIFPPESNVEKVMIQGAPEQLSQKLYALLKERKFI